MRLYITDEVATVGKVFKPGEIAEVQKPLAEALIRQKKAVLASDAGKLLTPKQEEPEPESEKAEDSPEEEPEAEPEEEQKADDEDGQCKAITSSGNRCKKKALSGSDYCSVHQELEE